MRRTAVPVTQRSFQYCFSGYRGAGLVARRAVVAAVALSADRFYTGVTTAVNGASLSRLLNR